MNKEEYLLECLAEECSEVIQRICKAKRFGLEEIQKSNPEETRNNRQRIAYELNDLITVVSLLQNLHKDYEYSETSKIVKLEKIHRYMKYSQQLNILKV